MSKRVNQSHGSTTKRPIKLDIEFKGNTGAIKYYDKATSQDVVLKSMDLVLLTIKKSVSGFHGDSNSSIYSNLVSNVSEEELEVKAFKANKPLAKGLYTDIKDKIASEGGKFTTNLIALAKINGEWEVVSFNLVKSGIAAWMDFNETISDKSLLYTSLISVSKGEKRKKGAINYVVPNFELKELSDELSELAEVKFEEVDSYFSSSNAQDTPELPTPSDAPSSETSLF